jgi:hypothetical protein
LLVGLTLGAALTRPSAAQPNYSGLSADDCTAVLRQITPEAPIVYLRYFPDLLPGREAIVIGTTLYWTADGSVRPAKVWIFAGSDSGWSLFHETDMDARLAAQHAPRDWEIGLTRIEAADLDEDDLQELVIWWISEPQQGFSLSQLGSILHVLDYDSEKGALREVTDDQIVCNQYTERAVLLNVDCDDADEIVVLNEIWEPDTCVECPKRFRIDVWTVAQGELARDPAWNGGQPLETAAQFSLLDPIGCNLVDLLRFVLACPVQEP